MKGRRKSQPTLCYVRTYVRLVLLLDLMKLKKCTSGFLSKNVEDFVERGRKGIWNIQWCVHHKQQCISLSNPEPPPPPILSRFPPPSLPLVSRSSFQGFWYVLWILSVYLDSCVVIDLLNIYFTFYHPINCHLYLAGISYVRIVSLLNTQFSFKTSVMAFDLCISLFGKVRRTEGGIVGN